MTIGWGWGRTACGRGNNHILANKIANSNLDRCCDGGQVIIHPETVLLFGHGNSKSLSAAFRRSAESVWNGRCTRWGRSRRRRLSGTI